LAKHYNTSHITLVDPSADSLAVATDRIRETGFLGAVRTHESIREISGHFSFVVISSSSLQRPSALREFLELSSADNILLEKLLASDLGGLEEIADLAKGEIGQFWVNCPMPYFLHYSELKEKISTIGKESPVYYKVRGSNLGLVTNMIHYLDHFMKLTGRPVSDLVFDSKSVTIPSKRMGYSELLGKAIARTELKDELTVEFQEKPLPELVVEISCSGWVWTVDEIKLTLESKAPGGFTDELSITTPMQSDLTQISLERIDAGEVPHWSDLESSLAAHRLLLEAISKHIGPTSDLVFT
jgi:hypothetical protein